MLSSQFCINKVISHKVLALLNQIHVILLECESLGNNLAMDYKNDLHTPLKTLHDNKRQKINPGNKNVSARAWPENKTFQSK